MMTDKQIWFLRNVCRMSDKDIINTTSREAVQIIGEKKRELERTKELITSRHEKKRW